MAEQTDRQDVGIDVAKETLEVVILPTNRTWQVPNTPAGWADLTTQVAAATCVVLEATNTYHVGVTLALAEAGIPVTVVNPARTHAFAKSEGIRAKTDRHDARLLARYGQQKQPDATSLPSATMRELTALVRARSDLTDALIVAKNHLVSATHPTVQAIHQARVDQLKQQRRDLDAAITAQVATDPVLVDRRHLITTVPGAGVVISAALVAELPELGLVDAMAAASLAGVAPHPRDSGKTQKPRLCIGGRRQVAKALYQLAVSAVRWNPVIQAHYEQLRVRRPHKVAMVACARRLLGILTAMLRDGLTWEETRVGQGQFLPDVA